MIQLNSPPLTGGLLLERKIPAIGTSEAEKLKTISQQSCAVLPKMDLRIRWVKAV